MIGRKDPAATGKAWNTGDSNAKTQREEWACWVLEIERKVERGDTGQHQGTGQSQGVESPAGHMKESGFILSGVGNH